MNYKLLREVIFEEDSPLTRAVTHIIGDEVANYTDNTVNTHEAYANRVYSYVKSSINGFIPINKDVLSLLFGEGIRNIRVTTALLTIKMLKSADNSNRYIFILKDEKSNIEYSL